MADTGAPAFLPLFGDGDPFTPIQTPFNAISTALNTALGNDVKNKYKRIDTFSNLNLPANNGTDVGQHAIVYADPSQYRNGDYVWTGTGWIAAGPKYLPAATGRTGAMPAAAIPIIQTGRFVGATSTAGSIPWVPFPVAFPNGVSTIQLTTGTGSASGAVVNGDQFSTTGFAAVIGGTSGVNISLYWTATGW